MALIFNLRHLEKKALRLRGELPVADLELDGIDECIQVKQPLAYDLMLELISGAVLVQGQLRLPLECTCVRCLKPFQMQLEMGEWTRHLAREGEDRITVTNDDVDLTTYLREDILLAFPQHPLCEPECSGLPYASTSSVSLAGRAGQNGAVSTAWAELNKLKF